MRLYTGRGDDGRTDLLGARVDKDDPRIEAIGALDETTSAIGFARALATVERVQNDLLTAQRDLYKIMAELAFTEQTRPASSGIDVDRVAWVGDESDALAAEVELPREFVVPGESAPGAALDVARAVSRRAERHVVAMGHFGHPANPVILGYLNRLSTLLFAAARVEDHAAGKEPRRAKTR